VGFVPKVFSWTLDTVAPAATAWFNVIGITIEFPRGRGFGGNFEETTVPVDCGLFVEVTGFEPAHE